MQAYLLLALTPLILIVVLLLFLKRPLYQAAPITLVYTAILAYVVWQEELPFAQAAIGKGGLIALDILLIIFGAIFFLRFLQKTGLIEDLESYLTSISPDQRIQTILLAWFFLSFIEGMSGFGTPMAIVAPLLVGLGFPAVTAVAVALVGVGTSVAFGAVGTPIRVGLAGLPTEQVPLYAAGINLFVGALMPIFIIWTLLRLTGRDERGKLREILPFLLFAGFALTIPYFAASFIGQEFPSLLGPPVGLVITIIALKTGWFAPKRVWRLSAKKSPLIRSPSLVKTLLPYVVFIALLLAGKLFLDGKWTVSLPAGVAGTIAHFNPGYAFIVAVFVAAALEKVSLETVVAAAGSAFKTLLKPFVAIFCISAFVQLMIYSGNNPIGMPGMLDLLGGILVTPLLPFLAPFVGMFGAFVSGSATVSNLLFANFQYKAATTLGLDTQPILALQTIGGGVGNTVSLTDISAVEATVGLHNEENTLLRAVAPPVLAYLTLAGLLGLCIAYLL